jgi:7-cyano-7-deazaguanine synthase
MEENNKKLAVLSLSGGMDSSTLLLHLLANNYEVTALSFDYGQKHKVELERAQELIQYLDSKGQKVRHKVIRLDGLTELLSSALVEGGEEVPEGHYEQANMKETVVPNRNKIFSSIIQAVALSLATQRNADVSISLGIHSGDHAIYPDCRQEFRDIDFQAFQVGNWDSDKVKIYTPYLEGNKFTILQDGLKACETLGLDFNEVYRRTNTSYKPIKVYHRLETLGYKWYSDYKSASSVERILAFAELGYPDPVEYADESGPVEWGTVLTHAQKIEVDFRTKQNN